MYDISVSFQGHIGTILIVRHFCSLKLDAYRFFLYITEVQHKHSLYEFLPRYKLRIKIAFRSHTAGGSAEKEKTKEKQWMDLMLYSFVIAARHA